MATLQFTDISEQDLDALWLYIAQDSIQYADKFIEKNYYQMSAISRKSKNRTKTRRTIQGYL